MKLLVLFLATLLPLSHAGWSWGWCPDVQLLSSFNPSQYMGVWYQTVRDKAAKYEYGDCSQAGYTLRSDGIVTVFNSQYRFKEDKNDYIKFTAKCKGPKCKVGNPPFRLGDYRVVDTDYNNWVVVTSCQGYLFFRFETVWILSRVPNLDAANRAIAE